jgi:acyl-CoA thioester hydrolase
MTTQPTLESFPVRAFDKLRYGDTDRQGHVNNAVFATFFETGRCEFLLDARATIVGPGQSLVLARLEVDLVAEVHWPGTVEIGTAVTRIGRSSVGLTQALFQNGTLVARASSVVVLTDETTRRSTPLSEEAVARLEALRVDGATA